MEAILLNKNKKSGAIPKRSGNCTTFIDIKFGEDITAIHRYPSPKWSIIYGCFHSTCLFRLSGKYEPPGAVCFRNMVGV